MLEYKTVEERKKERQELSSQIERNRENRELKKEIDRVEGKRKKFTFKAIKGSLIISASLVSALLGATTKPSDIGFVADANTTSIEKIQDDSNDYHTKHYYIESIDGERYDVPFEVLDEAVPTVRETETFVNFSDGSKVPIGITRVEKYPGTKILLYMASVIGVLSGGTMSFKAGKNIGLADQEKERLQSKLR